MEKELRRLNELISEISSLILILTIVQMASCSASSWVSLAKADPIKIAIIDTGYMPSLIHPPRLKLCTTGHVDYSKTQGKEKIVSLKEFGPRHGTAVAEIIANELVDVDYCAIVYTVTTYNRAEDIVSALYKAAEAHVDVINLSYAGDIISVAEREAIKDASAKVGALFAAAGNTNEDLDSDCLSFPACFDVPNMIIVGALDQRDGRKAAYSNYGKERVKQWFSGRGLFGMQGTSFAVPRAVASYIKRKSDTQTPIKRQSEKPVMQLTNIPTSTTDSTN